MVWKSNRYVFFEMFSTSCNFAISKKSSTFALVFDQGVLIFFALMAGNTKE